MKLTAWITFILLSIFVMKIAIQKKPLDSSRDIASEKSLTPVIR